MKLRPDALHLLETIWEEDENIIFEFRYQEPVTEPLVLTDVRVESAGNR